jgi:hypothetical protein
MSRTHKLTDERETPTRQAISFMERPSSRRSLRASNRSSVFMTENITKAADVVRAGDRTRTGDILLGRQELYQLSYARV